MHIFSRSVGVLLSDGLGKRICTLCLSAGGLASGSSSEATRLTESTEVHRDVDVNYRACEVSHEMGADAAAVLAELLGFSQTAGNSAKFNAARKFW